MAAMNKSAAIRSVIAATTTEPIIFTTGYACRIANGINDRPNHFYMTGSMGLASSIAVGVALETRRTTVVVDGDGSLLMNPVGLITAGAHDGLRLIHILLDDRMYASTGGQQVPSARADICSLAHASGYPRVIRTAELEDFRYMVRTEVASCHSPIFIHAVLSDPDAPVPGRVTADLRLHARRFTHHLCAR
jgi:thiamine pyrophosphate-dependent acetolactate synthase large subunit-like protein